MSLINCPECGKQISDKADKCINCGYPIPHKNVCNINGNDVDLSFLLDESYPYLSKLKDFIQLSGSSISYIKPVVDKIIEEKQIPKTLNILPPKEHQKSTPKCPKCGSTAITSSARGINFTFGLLGASKTVNRCANCGHTWKPR